MRRKRSYVAALVLAVAVLFGMWGATTNATRQHPATQASASALPPPRPKFQGVAVSRGTRLVMRTEAGHELPLTLGPDASEFGVTRDSEHASIDDIQEGDLLNVVLNHDGTAYRVDALSAAGESAGTTFRVSLARSWLLLFVLLALALATLVIIWSARTRSNVAGPIHDTTRTG